tara:strand:+ start:1504 stop:1620 length:117 start_codon:yes stop_codon:yes gene_type:complete
MVIGFFVLFIMPIAICLLGLFISDYIKKLKKFKKNQKR